MGYDKHYRKDVFFKGSAVYGLKVYSQTLTPAITTSTPVSSQAFTITGLTTADRVLAIDTAAGTPFGIVGARVSAANTLTIYFMKDATVGTPSAGTFRVIVLRV